MIIDHPTPRGSAPPPVRGAYWACQILGWGVFCAFVTAGYLLSAQGRTQFRDFANIVVFTLVLCPAVSHGLRYVMWRRGWVDLPVLSKRFQRVVPAVVLCAATLTTLTAVSLYVLNGPPVLDVTGFVSMLVNYSLAFGGWTAIYFAVRGRQRHREAIAAARDAQFHVLKSQLNPHFLFNCLNSVRALISEDPKRAASMVTGLSDLLRYSLTSDRHDTVTLAEELAIVDEYVKLERVRFEERLRTEQTIDPAALTARVPPMLVQTLVENGVKHGITDSVSGGLIRIHAAVVDAHVEIAITNTGRFEPRANGNGQGLRNATERLRLLYGARASLVVRADGDQTVAAVSLPLDPPP